jgi:hypothetical protein
VASRCPDSFFMVATWAAWTRPCRSHHAVPEYLLLYSSSRQRNSIQVRVHCESRNATEESGAQGCTREWRGTLRGPRRGARRPNKDVMFNIINIILYKLGHRRISKGSSFGMCETPTGELGWMRKRSALPEYIVRRVRCSGVRQSQEH